MLDEHPQSSLSDTGDAAISSEDAQQEDQLRQQQSKSSSSAATKPKSTEGKTANNNKLVAPKKNAHDKDRQLALARASAAWKRAAKERGEITREPAAKELILPYRAIRRIMKLDKENSTIQIEAAIIATKAAELFVQKMAKESHKHAKEHGRNGIKYEDIAETRATNPNLSFLDNLLP